ncbi:hypothetical protein ACVW1A_007170 [Bradyrhizobium sp. LB1.3]
MDNAGFDAVKSKLDAEIDGLPEKPEVRIKLGWDLYREFRVRKLLQPKIADFLLHKWPLASYRDRFVWDAFDVADDQYVIGKPGN